MKGSFVCMLVLLILATSSKVRGQFAYSTNADGSIYTYGTNADGTANIAAYSGPSWVVTIPTAVNGLPVTSIAFGAFLACGSLTSITIPESVTSIGEAAFDNCTNLTSVNLANGIASIGANAFFRCPSLASVIIPESVTNIGDDPFGASISLKSITVDTNNLFYSSVNGVLFDKNQTTLIQYPSGLSGIYTIPGSVNSIADNAFGSCTNLNSVIVPASVSSIGVSAFDDCISLTNVNIANGVTNIGYGAFHDCTSLTSMTIPASVTSIGDLAFVGCNGLTNVYFQGNAPVLDFDEILFFGANATIYYLPGTTGWTSTFSGRPALPWTPLIETGDGSFGVRTNQFGFNITWASGMTVVLEVCSNLTTPVWNPVQRFTLTNGSYFFSEPVQTNASGRFYRVKSP
ncbi:MAG TPA: leucine-rich repeat domain-containing protein [Candidatus Saccharimonadales bacterium]|nr:leucine-rich repeat domain-containing protein [Candidatus Saccharimonadales bacterium]